MSNVAGRLTVLFGAPTDLSIVSAEPSAPSPELSGTAALSSTEAGPPADDGGTTLSATVSVDTEVPPDGVVPGNAATSLSQAVSES